MTLIKSNKSRTLEAILYPLLLLIILWSAFLLDRYFQLNLYKYGLKPRTIEGVKGIFFMPFIHGQKDFSHIINNSVPIAVLLSALIYFYREIALRVMLVLWLGGGILLWFIAANIHTYHIGISGVIYGLFGFLLLSGFLKKYLPLQAISLFVAFAYGSMIWGLFPTEERISWEGHLSGFLIGLLLAFALRKHGPMPPKYRYEIEHEMGIEPPDFEQEWKDRRKAWEEQQQRQLENLKREQEAKQPPQQASSENTISSSSNIHVEYNLTPASKKSDVNQKKK